MAAYIAGGNLPAPKYTGCKVIDGITTAYFTISLPLSFAAINKIDVKANKTLVLDPD